MHGIQEISTKFILRTTDLFSAVLNEIDRNNISRIMMRDMRPTPQQIIDTLTHSSKSTLATFQCDVWYSTELHTESESNGLPVFKLFALTLCSFFFLLLLLSGLRLISSYTYVFVHERVSCLCEYRWSSEWGLIKCTHSHWLFKSNEQLYTGKHFASFFILFCDFSLSAVGIAVWLQMNDRSCALWSLLRSVLTTISRTYCYE